MGYGKLNQVDQKTARKDAFIKLGLGLVALLLIVDTIQISRFGAIVERVDEYNKGVVDEIGGFRQDVSLMGADLNEMRQFLLMPTREYSFMETTKIEDADTAPQLSSTEKAAYNFLTSFLSEQKFAENSTLAEQRIKSLVANAELATALTQNGLTIDSEVLSTDATFGFKISDKEIGALASILCEKSTNKLIAQSILGTQDLGSENDSSSVQKYITANKDKIIATKKTVEERKTAITNAMQSEAISAALKEKAVTFDTNPVDTAETLDLLVKNKDGAPALTIRINKKDGAIIAETTSLDLSKDITAQLLPLIQNIDTKTESEKLITERRAELEKVFSEKAFADMLTQAGLTVTEEPREDYNKLIYDVKDATGTVRFSFVIEISSGLYKVLKDNQEIDFYTLLQDEGSKKKP